MSNRFEKYTNGPWVRGRPDMATYVDGEPSKWIYAGDKHIAVASGKDVSWPEVIANATLIAHAPEMLDALRQWQSAESMGDEAELENARRSRDEVLKTLGDQL